MCDPLSITISAAALSAAASMKQAQEQNKYAARVTNAQTAVSAAEAERQKGYIANSEQAATDAQGGFTRQAQDAKLAQAQEDRNNTASAAISDQTPYEASSTTPSIVNETMAKSISDALAKGKSQTQALSNLSAFGDVNQGNKIALNQSGQKIAEQQGFAANSQALLPFELQAAKAGAKPAATWPGVVAMLGQGLSLYGAAGGSFGLNSAANATHMAAPIQGLGEIQVSDLPPIR